MTNTINPKIAIVRNVYRSLIQSASVTFNKNWSRVQLHHSSLQLKHYKAVKFSVCGGPGTTGKVVNFTLNWGTTVPITLTAGAWTEFTVQLAQVGNPASLDNFIFQDNGNSDPRSPYSMQIDNIMFVG
jgi:hypothetical protein